ncbi:MAG: hypothetical protein OEZ06_13370 [Myxococcales bacterium]|nr:hypothetical protein [Myxococcales bacterium]
MTATQNGGGGRALLGWLRGRRAMLARLTLLLLAIAVGSELWPSVPRQTELLLQLGPLAPRVRELRLAYLRDGDELHGLTLHYPENTGAPPTVRHEVELSSGSVQLLCELRLRDGSTRRLERQFEVPAAGTVTLQP